MEVFNELNRGRHENLLFFQHLESGLKGVLAIHDSSLGPAVGGVRCWNYASEEFLIQDALKLAETDSLSAALSGCDAGGGKAIIWVKPEDKTETLLRAFGIFIHSLGGRFIASAELGTSSNDMQVIGKETPFVTGLYKGDGPESDYCSLTARGVYLGMKAAAKAVFGSASLKGRKIAVQGLGKVGTALIDFLVKEGAEIFISDLFFEKVKAARDRNPAAVMIPPDEIAFHPVDILSPCAVGSVLERASVKRLRCRIIAGAASNQLAEDGVAEDLAAAGILFLPDFLLNGGDKVVANAEIYGLPRSTCLPAMEKVYGLVESLLAEADSQKTAPFRIARSWALERMKKTRTLKKLFKPKS